MMATRRRPSRLAGRLTGRALVALGLALFLAATTVVVLRRSIGVRTVHTIERLREEQRALIAQEKYLESQLRRATSRRTVVQEAQRRLGMTRPTEAQTRFIVAPATTTAPATEMAVTDSVLVP